jgi:FdhD protein
MKKPSVDTPTQRPTQRQPIKRPGKTGWEAADDIVAREEPLEVLVRIGTVDRRLGLLLRTPGNDPDLAVGLLFAEGIINDATDVRGVTFEPASGENQEFNSVRVELQPNATVDWDQVARPLVMTAACGVCGRAMLSGLHEHARPAPPRGFVVARDVLLKLPATLRREQEVFDRTGGLHATALFDAAGKLELLREDVGRHNAVDKVVGHLFQTRRLPANDWMILVSGRAGYEIVQKAIRAGIPFVAAVGAPSSLAVDTAKEFGTTLVGFLRDERFNVYSGAERILPSA